MGNLFKIAVRNLIRYKRRTLLTASLAAIGVVFVLVFVAASDSFKTMIVNQITGSMLGDLQIHKKGYVASIENLPLTMNLKPQAVALAEKVLKNIPEIEAYSPRIKFGALFSTFNETTNVRLNGILPEREMKTVPFLTDRISQGEKTVKRGEIVVPDLIAKGMKVKVGDTVVVIATNRDGSVNGKQLRVSGIIESATGPGGRDGYVHIEDAMEILRLEEREVSEIAVRLKDFNRLHVVAAQLKNALAGIRNPRGQPVFEVHTWEALSPFFNIAQMIGVMTLFIKIMLIAIVLVSVMNVMIMAVYERMREIGTIAAIGTLPARILSLFLIEGFCLGAFGALIGTAVSLVIVWLLNWIKIPFHFARQSFVLSPTVSWNDVLITGLIVIVVAVLGSLQPAFKASRLEPIEALRHV